MNSEEKKITRKGCAPPVIFGFNHKAHYAPTAKFQQKRVIAI